MGVPARFPASEDHIRQIEDIAKGDVLASTDSNGTGYFRVVRVHPTMVTLIGENGNKVRAYPHLFERKVTYPVATLPALTDEELTPDTNDIAGRVAAMLLPFGAIDRRQTGTGSEVVKFTPAWGGGAAFNLTITRARNG